MIARKLNANLNLIEQLFVPPQEMDPYVINEEKEYVMIAIEERVPRLRNRIRSMRIAKRKMTTHEVAFCHMDDQVVEDPDDIIEIKRKFSGDLKHELLLKNDEAEQQRFS